MIGEFYDTSTFHLSRQVSWIRMYYGAKWGRTWHNVPETLINTTV